MILVMLLYNKKLLGVSLSCTNRLQVVNESLNPVWNQTFDFVVEDGLHDMLMLEVYDHDTFSRVLLEEEYTESFNLDGAKSGKLNLHLKWSPQPIMRDLRE
ncbi:hypothetical protein PR202_ga18820 [Eleusine coracana subsp. coracana]|uniref:C2 domain-containing protein n=1 Tax=Eleusine coracana subsp. coracana TaxID=191504 RepID=A0AAV5CTT4_ELECO|nr:hypothetical protein PR202_ga18820 [Eleusine coracana subsp. coracana]